MGDFNGDLGNSLGDKAKHETNQRGLKLLDFANCFNFCPVNLIAWLPFTANSMTMTQKTKRLCG